MRLIVLVVSFFSLAGLAHATTLYVSNSGVDSPTCGTPGSPCRSISRGIHNAGQGDTISVGPGVYGDLNQNGTWTDAGDETAEIGFGCNCIVRVDIPLTILSRDGAATTLIDANGENADAVTILANHVVFGTPKHGFTLLNSGNNGLTISNSISAATVAGNRSVGNNGEGFFLAGSSISNVVVGNVSTANGSRGFDVDGNNQQLLGNAATANGRSGIRVAGTNAVLSGNVMADNARDGLEVLTATRNLSITKNTATSNQRCGILLNADAVATITGNNLFGNGASPFNLFSTPGVTNLAIANGSGVTITALRNFFGAASGPGGDPADDIRNFDGSATTNVPFATKEIKVKAVAP